MPTSRAGIALPAGLVVTGAVSVQCGAAFATRLFTRLPAAAVTTLRLWPAALIMLLLAGRPAGRAVTDLIARRDWRDAVIALSFGVALGFMNFAIYQAFARIPLGISVTVEFLGPLTVTVAGALRSSRRAAGLGYAALALAGVVLLAGGVSGTSLNWAGVWWAAAAGAAWAAYILGSKAAGQRLPGASGLVIGMCAAALVVTPPGVIAGAPEMFRPQFLAAGAGIGLLSSVVPYWLELEALRRVPASLFGVWMSVQPAIAAVIGLALLSQHLSPAEWAGICCVAVASAGASAGAAAGAARTRPDPPPPAACPPRARLAWGACFPDLSPRSGRSSPRSGSRRHGR